MGYSYLIFIYAFFNIYFFIWNAHAHGHGMKLRWPVPPQLMMTSSNKLTLCARNSPFTGEFPLRPVTRGCDVFFYLCPNKRLSKQSWTWWFETPSPSLWRHCNVMTDLFNDTKPLLDGEHSKIMKCTKRYVYEIHHSCLSFRNYSCSSCQLGAPFTNMD